MKRLNLVNVSVLATAALAGAAFLLASGCHHSSNSGSSGQAPVTAPLAKITPISNCVVDSEQDVEIGGPNAKPGCDTVKMEPSFSNPASFDEIAINKGGTLIINGGDGNLTTNNTGVTRSTNSPDTYEETPVSEICVGDGGTLEFTRGTADKPITNTHKVELTFDDKASALGSNDICPDFHHKGIDVLKGGSLIMNGAKGVPTYGGVSWTTLAAPAGSNVAGAKVQSTGPKTLELTADVTKGTGPEGENEGWQPGDWIVVATTDYVPFHSEFVQIATVKSNAPDPGSTVTLKQPLKYYHFGSLPPSPATATCPDPLDNSTTQPAFLCDGPDRNYGVDERAEVGLISRDIELTSTTDPADPHRGGEIMIHQGFAKVEIQGVRLSKFGKDNLGSYPIHFHLVGDITKAPNPGTANVLVNADSVDHSYNKCVTIHATSNLTISNLVCARIVGHIFYEELESAGTTNPADDSGIVFDHDLGIGAMSNDFDIYAATDSNGKQWTREELIKKYWWAGDYMTNGQCAADSTCINYDGFDIPDTDNQEQPVHGFCWSNIDPNTGQYTGGTSATPCAKGSYYVEPASGFWIQNPKTDLVDDAIAGCQGVGVAYWWNSPGSGQTRVQDPTNPTDPSAYHLEDLSAYRFGTVDGDRASACYWGYNDAQELFVTGNQLSPHKDDITASPPLVAKLVNITATHIRRRAVWLRPLWFALTDGHFADNNRSVSLVTSGGIDGNAPGVWELLDDSVLVGESQDNVGRWGPCPKTAQFGANTGWQYGCIDYSHPGPGLVAHSGELNGLGYASPARNSFGYMIYDGPVRIFHDRFVNYNYDNSSGNHFSDELDDADRQALQTWESDNNKPYEGDAALGWFDSNQNAYPVTTVSKQLMWVNTNFRHQIYTEHVNLDKFNDGDKNTAIIDEDGTLDGFGVQLGPNAGTYFGPNASTTPLPEHPISLNNLPFNATSNSVDECFSGGAQNQKIEGRDTSLISPSEIGQLELSDLYPFETSTASPNYPGVPNSHHQYMTFWRTDTVPDVNGVPYHPSMTMQFGRNGQGLYEPKVASREGYYVTVSPSPNGSEAGFWKWIEVGLVDIEDPNITSKNPFYIKLGINYTDASGGHPPSYKYFTIERGYKSYRGGSISFGPKYQNNTDNHLLDYWTDWPNCFNIDDSNRGNVPHDGLPAGCPASDSAHPLETLTPVSSISGLYTNGQPNLDVYYYNKDTGYLWLNVAQNVANPIGPSPTGSCDPRVDGGTPDASCPDTKHGESYYGCPDVGCIIYSIAVQAPPGSTSSYAYTPGPSVGNPAAASLAPPPSTAQSEHNQLVDYANPNVIIKTKAHYDKQNAIYHTATNGPTCSPNQP